MRGTQNSGMILCEGKPMARHFVPIERRDYPYFEQRLRDRRRMLLDEIGLMLEKMDARCHARIACRLDEIEPRELSSLLVDPTPCAIRFIQELGDIASALARIEAKKYGECLQCGTRITRDSLSVQPTATLCAYCREFASHISSEGHFHEDR